VGNRFEDELNSCLSIPVNLSRRNGSRVVCAIYCVGSGLGLVGLHEASAGLTAKADDWRRSSGMGPLYIPVPKYRFTILGTYFLIKSEL
jgi:hypothetical protein